MGDRLGGTPENPLLFIDHQTGAAAFGFINMARFGIDHGGTIGLTGAAVVSSDICGKLEILRVRDLARIQAQQNMATGNFLGMEPEIVGRGHLEGEMIVLAVIATD